MREMLNWLLMCQSWMGSLSDHAWIEGICQIITQIGGFMGYYCVIVLARKVLSPVMEILFTPGRHVSLVCNRA